MLTCLRCGISFEDRSQDPLHPSIFCSRSCGKAYHCKRRKVKAGKVTDGMRKQVYKDDNYICQICFRFTRPDLPPNHDLYPSIDHIKPISEGGMSIRENLQTAHRGCNTRKDQR